MSDENEWDHRSNFNDPDGKQASSVTEAVHRRQKGVPLTREERRELLLGTSTDDGGAEDDSDPDERRVRDHFDPQHVPDDYEPEDPTGERSSREKLLDGERVQT